jgi:diguanylate cyclase (GGDEF)-like protein
MWILLTATVSLNFMGDLVWILRDATTAAYVPFQPEMSQVFYLAEFIPLALYALVVLTAGLVGTPVLTRVRHILDLAIAVIITNALVVIIVVAPARAALAPEDAPAWFAHSVLLLATVSIFVALIASVLEGRRGISMMRWEVKIVAAVGLSIIAALTVSIFRLYSVSSEFLGMRTFVDVLWMGVYFILTIAALEHGMDGGTVLTAATTHARRTTVRWYDLATAGVLLVAVPYILLEARYGDLGESEFWMVAAASLSVAVLVVTRSIILTSENGSLLFHTVVDPLTGAFNHRFFQERVAIEIDKARRLQSSVSLVLLDIDGFGLVNERMGHSHGDRCLIRMAEILRAHERAGDSVCRLGSDEFAVIMSDTDSAAATVRAYEMQEAVVKDPLIGGCVESVSIGIASMPEHADDRIALVARADGALYWAQTTGSGKIVAYDEEVVEALGPKQRLQIAEEQSYMQTVESLAAAVDARDPYTQFHSRNVSLLTGRLARQLGFSDSHVRLVEIAGVLHDVGKIGVPDSVLRKVGPLDSWERDQIEEHPDLGQRILSATIFKEILPWVLSHHECWDGSGYPHGLADEEIPLEARMLAVCDSFDAMVSDRPYRKGIPVEEAVQQIREHSGTQFDPYLADVFVELVHSDAVLRASYFAHPGVDTREPYSATLGRRSSGGAATNLDEKAG